MPDIEVPPPLNITGTVTANAGSGTFTVTNSSSGSVTPGELAGKSTLIGGVFNTQLPTPTNGQQVALQISSAARLLVDASGTIQPVIGTITANAGSGIFNVEVVEISDGVVHSYGTLTDIKHGTTGTINYTVNAGKVLYVKGIQASSSVGPCKVQLQIGTKPPTIFATAFYSSMSPHAEITFPQPISFPAGTVVSVVIQNNSGASQDLYAFLNGKEISVK